MASNPMQRKAKNSFLLGVLITLLITGVIIALLFFMLKEKSDKLEAEQRAKRNVYTLTQDVKAGQTLTEDMFALKAIHSDSIPNSATSTAEVIESWFLQTKEGESISTDKYGWYLDRTNEERGADSIIEVMKNNGETVEDTKGNKIQNGEFYVVANGVTEKVSSTNNVQTDEFGMFIVDTQGNDKIVRIYQEAATEEFYMFKLDTATMNMTGSKTRVKEYIDIKNVPVLAKVDMNANTVVTPNLVVQSDEVVTDDTRKQEYNMVVLPVDVMTNDYVDIRLMTPGGQDFIVVSKAQIDIPMNSDGTYVVDTMRVNLREDETLAMSSAIVEAYGLEGAKLYVTKYVDPAMQAAALPTYTPNAEVTAQIQANPNIVDLAKDELASRYSEAAKNARNQYLQNLINTTDKYMDNINKEATEDIGSSLTTRQKYLESLNY